MTSRRINSRRKGACGEREAAALLRELFGWQSARRSQQFCGQAETADLIVEDTPDIYWEIKRVQRLSVPKTMAKARTDAGRKVAALLHRQDRSEWLLTIFIEDLPRLVHAYESALQEPRGHETMVTEELSAKQNASDSKGCR